MKAVTIKNKFDDVLSQNMERLIGTRYAIGGLPASVNAFSCIILLNEQIRSEIGENSIVLEEYSRETLFGELEEMGFDTGDGMNATIGDMVGKGYIEFDEDNRILVKKPTVTMARLLDRIYPKMPGLNLIAYLSQVLDEVQSGRKDPNSATDQLDQVLHMHGVSLKRKQSMPSNGGTRTDNLRYKVMQTLSQINTDRQDGRGKVIKASDVQISRKTAASDSVSNSSPVSPVSPDKSDFYEEPQKVESDAPVVDKSPSAPQVLDVQKHVDSARSNEEHEKADKVENTVHEPEHLGISESSHEEEPPVSDTITESVIASEKTDTDNADTSIESQIAAFEEGLAMRCPLCNIGDVQVHDTSTGRKYYACSHKDCTFISWGKPYHRSCPECGNNFLVEAVFKGGVPVLKCPRATCLYWQKHPSELMDDVQSDGTEAASEAPARCVAVAKKPRKKVVRRKVIRRKS